MPETKSTPKPPETKTGDKQPVIMQVIPTLISGGAEQGCIDIAAELVRAGAKAIVVSHGGKRVHDIARIGGIHINLPVHSKNPLVMLNNMWALRKIIHAHNVDIVHVRSRAPAWSCYYACKGTAARYMTTCHAPYNINGSAKRFYNSIMARGERVIAISEHVARYLRKNYKIDESRICVIHRGVALEKFHPTAVTAERMITLSKKWRIPDGAPIILLPGRLTRWKGYHVLIEAMGLLGRPDVFCVLIGSDQGRNGSYRQELEEAIQSRNLGGNVRIVDHCDDMPAAYMLAGVVVSASTDPEGFGRIAVEGQAMGRPMIATDHGGSQETIVRGETGWLIPHSDPRALVKALSEALALDPTQRAVLATRAMAHIAENFTREKMADETLNVYAALLEEKKAQNEPLKAQKISSPIKQDKAVA